MRARFRTCVGFQESQSANNAVVHSSLTGMRTRVYVILGALVALAIAAVASGASTPGVTSSEVVIGGTTPLTGPAASYASVARGAAAYFKYVNSKGGVNKRKIKYI